jgi:hypothetical protein
LCNISIFTRRTRSNFPGSATSPATNSMPKNSEKQRQNSEGFAVISGAGSSAVQDFRGGREEAG